MKLANQYNAPVILAGKAKLPARDFIDTRTYKRITQEEAEQIVTKWSKK